MSELKAVPTAVTDLEVGMFVTALDRAWIDTPFLVEGFYIGTQADIEALEQYCEFVYVDVSRSRAAEVRRNSRLVGSTGVGRRNRTPVSTSGNGASAAFDSGQRRAMAELFPHRKRKLYEDLHGFDDELKRARGAYVDTVLAYRDMMEGYRTSGKLDVSGIRQVVVPLVDSMLRNPDACVWLARNRDGANYITGHSVGAAVWAVALGRQMGLPRVDLQRLGIGGLLLDVGKLRIPEGLLDKPSQLSSGEFQLVRSHVEFGLEMLRDTGIMNRTINDMIEFHHERHAGHGYPRGLQDRDIPIFGRIAGVVDCFDAITSPRPYSKPIAPSSAIKRLYAWRDVEFQAEVVEEFIQAIGVYPSGTLVELSNGEVGITTAGHRSGRFRPQLLLLRDRDGNPLAEPRPLDLRLVTHDADGEPLEIISGLDPDACDIDLARLPI